MFFLSGEIPSPPFAHLPAFGNLYIQLDCRNKGRKNSQIIIDSIISPKDKDKEWKSDPYRY